MRGNWLGDTVGPFPYCGIIKSRREVNETGTYTELEDPSPSNKPVQPPNFRYQIRRQSAAPQMHMQNVLVAKLSAHAGIIPEYLSASQFWICLEHLCWRNAFVSNHRGSSAASQWKLRFWFPRFLHPKHSVWFLCCPFLRFCMWFLQKEIFYFFFFYKVACPQRGSGWEWVLMHSAKKTCRL